ncbi:hypothetical protein C9I99_14240 [Photobacterium lutimaris]|uniref:Uncharacterized protein n=1 Tax=Photobacterium lutimaris TaxID=388278 RepID=A0A2T3IXT9_9GAMM|nr:hypothetical protein C9I99_14240 [Photobacterium lutimaris]
MVGEKIQIICEVAINSLKRVLTSTDFESLRAKMHTKIVKKAEAYYKNKLGKPKKPQSHQE